MQIGTCENTCEELGRAAKEEAERVQKIYMAGHEIRSQLIAKGKDLRLEKQVNCFNKSVGFLHGKNTASYCRCALTQ